MIGICCNKGYTILLVSFVNNDMIHAMKKNISDYNDQIDPNKFWSRVNKAGACWLWMGGKNTTGYGLFSLPSPPWLYERTGRMKTQLLAHRVAYHLTYGIPDAIKYEKEDYVLHKCDVRACCNPDHMWIGTHQDNMDDMIAKRYSRQ